MTKGAFAGMAMFFTLSTLKLLVEHVPVPPGWHPGIFIALGAAIFTGLAVGWPND